MQNQVLLFNLYILRPSVKYDLLLSSFKTLGLLLQSFIIASCMIMTLLILISMAIGSVSSRYLKESFKSRKSLIALVGLVFAFAGLAVLWRTKAYKLVAPYLIYVPIQVRKKYDALVNCIGKYILVICGIAFAASLVFALLERKPFKSKCLVTIDF